MEENNKLLKSALWYLEKGYSLIPINPGTKEPFYGFKWERYKKTQPTQEEVRAWWGTQPNANIALVLGEVSKLIALDIDDIETLNGHEIPTTPKAISGGKRLPHYYFEYVPGCRNYTRLENKSEKFSIRCDGRYIIAPPSKHQSGGVYEWAPGLGIHEVPLAKPLDWMMELMSSNGEDESQVFNSDFSEATWQRIKEAILDLILPYWTKGERQELSMCLAGFLAKQGIPWAHTNKLILEIAKLSKDNEIGQRIGAIKATYERAKRGEKVKGYMGLREILTPEDLQSLASLFESSRAKAEDKEEYHGLADKEIVPQFAFPFDIFTPELRGFIERVSEALQVEPGVVAGIALCFLSGCIGNTIRVSPKYGHEAPLFLWLIIVARSGYGKSPAFNALIRPVQNLQALKHTAYKDALKEYKRLVRMAKQDPSIDLPEEPQIEHLYFSDTTVEALSRGFESTHRGVISYQDELAGMILGLNQYKASGRGNDLQHYLELFDCIPWKIDRRGETRVILNTGASITGGIQPQVMPRVFSNDCFDNGLIPRFLFIKADNKPQKYSRKGIEEKDVRFWNNLIKLCYQIPLKLNDAGIAEPKILILSEDAQAIWEAFYNEYAEIIPFLSERAQVFLPKLMTYCLKFMGLLHILQLLNSKVTEVTDVIVVNVVLSKKNCENAIKLTRFFIGQAINILDLYKPKEPQLTEYEYRLIKTLYALKDSVIKGQLLFSLIVEVFNKSLPNNLQLTSERISSLLNRGLGLKTVKGGGNKVFLIWEPGKITKLFSRINDNNDNDDNNDNSNSTKDAPTYTNSEHSESCDCAECTLAQEEVEGEFIRYRGDS